MRGRLPTFVCTPGIMWVKDAGQTILVDRAENRSWLLRGPEAVVWDLLTLNGADGDEAAPGCRERYPFENIVRFLAVLLNLPLPEARESLVSILRKWQEEGIVCATERQRRG